jgi:hypothetical protein
MRKRRERMELKDILRAMAWERVKGELMAIEATYEGEREKFEAFQGEVKRFTERVELHGWVE